MQLIATLAGRLTSGDAVVILLAIMGLPLALIAVAGSVQSRSVSLVLQTAPRVLLGLVALLLLTPAIAAGLQRFLPSSVAASACSLYPSETICRGVPIRIGSKWFLIGATHVIRNATDIYLLSGEPDAIRYTVAAGDSQMFEVDGQPYRFDHIAVVEGGQCVTGRIRNLRTCP